MPKALTAIAVEKAKAGPSRKEIPDGLLTGLYLVVQPTGAKSWAVRYRHDGRPRKFTLGSFPMLDLREARGAAQSALQLVASGEDPASANPVKQRELVKDVVAEFLDKHMKGKRSKSEVERMFRANVLPEWGERSIQEITRRDVLNLLDGLTGRGVGTMTNRVFSIVRKLFNWAITRDIVTASPCAGMRAPVEEVPRDRVLEDDEIRWFWKAASGLGYPFGPLFLLLLITGQRLSEVSDMTAGELRLSERLWKLPKERVKNANAHDVPLSEAALAVIDKVPRIAGSAFLFTTTGKTSVSGFSRAKANLDRAMLAFAKEDAGKDANIPEWRLHDLRRTAASGMARLGISLPVIEKALNHTSGSFAGIVGVYQRHSFADEKRNALEAWGRFLVALVTGATAANIVRLERAL